MIKQTVADFVAKGGTIQHVTYKSFSEIGNAPVFGMRQLINKHKMSVYVGRKGKHKKARG